MKVHKATVSGTIPAGTRVWLSKEQAEARAHVISAVDTDDKVKGRTLYVANDQLSFKAGEELAIEGDHDRGVDLLLGIEPKAGETAKAGGKGGKVPLTDAALSKAFSDGQQVGAAALLSDIERTLGLTPLSLEERLAGGGAGNSVVLEAIAKAKAEGRAEMMAEVDAYNAAVDALDEAEATLDAADDAGKAAAQATVDAASAAVLALPELKA